MFLPYYAQKYNRKQKTFNVARESWAEISNNNTVDECLMGMCMFDFFFRKTMRVLLVL